MGIALSDWKRVVSAVSVVEGQIPTLCACCATAEESRVENHKAGHIAAVAS